MAYNVDIRFRVTKEGQGAREVEKELDGFGKRLNGTLDLMNKSAVAALAAGATFKKAFELGKEGAALNQLTESFNLMNREVFHTPGLLEQMRASVRGTVKDTDLMKGILTLTAGTSRELSQAFAESSPRLLEIAKAAQKLNPTLGDTAFLYDSLARGIKRSSPLILDNLGVVVKVGDANAKWAEHLGKSVTQLTAEEKQMALLNAVLEKGDQLIAQVGGNIDSQTDSWAQLEVRIGEAVDGVKRYMADGLTPLIREYLRLIDAIQRRKDAHREEIDQQREALVIDQEASRRAGHRVYVIDQELMERNRLTEAEADAAAQEDELADAIEETTFSLEESTRRIEENRQAYEDALKVGELRREAMQREIDLTAEVEDSAIRGERAFDRLARQEERRLLLEEDLAKTGEAAAEATDRLADATGRYFEEALKADRETSLYGFSLEDLGTQFVRVSSLTKDQKEDLERLRDAYDRTARRLRDYEIGLDGAGLSSDELAEAMQEERDEMGRLQAAMDPLLAVTDSYREVTHNAAFNQAALGQALLDATEAAGANYETIFELHAALDGGAYKVDNYSKAQLRAALAAATMQAYIVDLGKKIAEGMSIPDAIAELDAMQQKLSEPYVINFDDSKLSRALEKLRNISSELDSLEGRHTRSTHTVETHYESTGTPPETRGSDKNGGGGPTQPVGGPVPAQHGLDMIVPPGFWRDNFRIGVSSGEHVRVTPAGQASAGGATFVFDFRGAYVVDPNTTELAIERALSRQGVRADMRRRVQ